MRTLLLLGCITVLFAVSGRCDTMAELLSGRAIPLSVQIKALDAEWRQFTLSGAQGSVADLLTAMAKAQTGGTLNDIYVTQGKTIAIGSETYLVVYHREQKSTISENGWAVTTEPVTPEAQLSLSLLNLRVIGYMRDIKPFDLKSLQDNSAVILQTAGRKAREATLKANLHQLRNALEQFQADTGLYPEKLTDLTLAKANAPKRGLDDQKKLVDLPAGAYQGPYLAGGGIGDTGIPLNPFADPNNADLDAHWAYSIDGPGFVHPAVPTEGATYDGVPYGQL